MVGGFGKPIAGPTPLQVSKDMLANAPPRWQSGQIARTLSLTSVVVAEHAWPGQYSHVKLLVDVEAPPIAAFPHVYATV